jgi:murein DD-endopeptidase MepM/ murein hydrolase activator NlpD
MGAPTTSCLDCGTPLSLIEGLAVIRGGAVGVVCKTCPTAAEPEPSPAPAPRPKPVAALTLTPATPRVRARSRADRRRQRLVPAVAIVAAVGLTGYLSHASRPPTANALDTLQISIDDPPPRLGRVTTDALEPPLVHALTYSLTDEEAELPWVHPIAGELRELPTKDDRRFGAQRPGNRPAECGSGHCGVDLGEVRGTAIHAALGGRIIRVKHDASGASGRYVAIEHPQGLRSSYMHLDFVHPDLVVGMEIASGEAIGTLGKSGIHHSPAHLHFTVERKSDSGWQYVDPEPMLTQATVLETPAPLPASPDSISIDLSIKSLPVPPAPAARPRSDRTSSKAASEDNVLASAPSATAAPQARLRIDRVIAEPAWLPGMTRLRIYATAVTLQGAFVPVLGEPGKGGFVLKVGASKKKIPYLLGMYGGTEEPLSLGLVVGLTSDYADDFDEIKRELTKLLESLPNDAQVALVSYSDTVHATGRMSPAAAARKLARLFPDSAPTEQALIKAVSRAVRIVDRIKLQPPYTSARKILVVVSDGKDLDFDPKRFKKAGVDAERRDVRIHSLAYSADDNRRPLLGLGELSKRSLGTFRWIRQRGLFAGQVKPLAEEIADQYLVTYFVPTEDVDKKRVSLLAGEIESNAVKVKLECGEKGGCDSDQYCAEGECVTRSSAGGSGILAWVLYIVGGLVGLLALLAGIGYLLGRRKPIPMPTAEQLAEVAGEPQDPSASSHRIQAVDASGQRVSTAHAAQPSPTGAHQIQPSGPSRQMSAQMPAQQIGGAPGGRAPMLYIVNGPNAGRYLPVVHGFTIGSSPGLHLSLHGDGFASGVHAQILMDTAGNCSIIDKGSTNGTFVNGVRTNNMRLTHGMSIKVGGAELRFMIQ